MAPSPSRSIYVSSLQLFTCRSQTQERCNLLIPEVTPHQIWPDSAQGSRARCGASVREGHSGCPFLLGAPVCHPSPRIRVSTVYAEAGKEAISSGFEPANALVRGLPLLRPPSFRDHLGCLPVL